MVLPWPRGPRPQGQTSEPTLFGGVEHAHQIARVVPAEVGVDEEQEVDAVAQRLLHEQLHVGALAARACGPIATRLAGCGSAARESVEGVVVARLVGEGRAGLSYEHAEHGRAGFDAIGQLHDSSASFRAGIPISRRAKDFLRGGRTRPLAAERHRLSGGR